MSSPAEVTGPAPADDDPQPTDRSPASDDADLGQLRALLIGHERERIGELERQLEDRERLARDVGRVLPDAIAQRSKPDQRLGAALTPTVEELIQQSVRNNPRAMAEAIFPILGPAIRKAIAHAIGGLLQAINTTIEQTLTVRSLQWRVQAWRTSRPFSEIVLANSIVYRTEQVLLVHRETGLLLQEISAPGIDSKEPELVSAMLTAIQDFVRDSFSAEQLDELEHLRVGELTLLIEQGPRALLCAAVRGIPDATVRTNLQGAIETIHEEKASALAAFDGEAAPFEAVRPIMEACISEQRRPEKRNSVTPILLAAAGIALLLAAGAWWLKAHERTQRWERYLDQLAAEPGIMVIDAGTRHGRYYVTGLWDVMAKKPGEVMQEFGFTDNTVEQRWEPYQASHPPFIMRRVEALLDPPIGASLHLIGQRLHAIGRASRAWVREAERRVQLLPWLDELVVDELEILDIETITAQESAAEELQIPFSAGSDLLNGPGRDRVATLLLRLAALDQTAEASDVSVIVTIIGAGDPADDEPHGIVLGKRRAERVLRALLARSWRVTSFDVQGRVAGSGEQGAIDGGLVRVDARVRRDERR